MEHFEHWISLFHATVDELFHGENAELIKDRAQTIAAIMVTKIVKFDQ
jgi:hemoglobin